jgi:hypothetical protein
MREFEIILLQTQSLSIKPFKVARYSFQKFMFRIFRIYSSADIWFFIYFDNSTFKLYSF